MTKTWQERFWAKIDKRGPDECWEWLGSRKDKGYGQVQRTDESGRKVLSSHRLAWEIANGPIPTGLFVCHHCDNPPCCNPAHLWLGTCRDNIHDMHAKGRQRKVYKLKSHCKRGHPLSGGNLRLRPDGRRECAACRQLWLAKYDNKPETKLRKETYYLENQEKLKAYAIEYRQRRKACDL